VLAARAERRCGGSIGWPAAATADQRGFVFETAHPPCSAEDEEPIVTSTSPHAGRALVVTVSDQLAHDEDGWVGVLVTELLSEAGFAVDGSVTVPSDEPDIRTALNTAVIGGVDLVVTVGGTGVSPRDVTPDVTAEVIDRELPGIAQALRWSGMAAGVVDAVISRGLVGISGSTLVANIAPSRAAIRDGLATLIPLATHVISELSDPGA
jgi:molybdenum cofactor synthesis domain-containing protein